MSKTRITITYEYTTGETGIKTFATVSEAYNWIYREGDHLLDYTVFP